MGTFRKHVLALLILAAAAVGLLSFAPSAPAGKPRSIARFAVLELPVDGDPLAISERDSAGVITIAIESGEMGKISAAYATIDTTTRHVLSAGFLPEPPYIDPNDGQFKNEWSLACDVNTAGAIVGSAAINNPEAVGVPSTSRAILWTRQGAGYAYELLPELPLTFESRAFGVNNWGDIVGECTPEGGDGTSVAVLWDANNLTVVDLNTEETAALGWELHRADKINDDGLIVGNGFLNGVWRGFVLDSLTGSIWPVPLAGPATWNSVSDISADGRVVGTARDGNGSPYGTNPGFCSAFSWDGPDATPVLLPSLTSNTSLAGGMNDLGATTGNSIIPTDEQFADPWVPTLWEFDDNGNVQATDLSAAIPSNSGITLIRGHDVNNDGWVSVYARKRGKNKATYQFRALLLTPNSN